MQSDFNNPYTAPESEHNSIKNEFEWLRFIPAIALMSMGVLAVCVWAVSSVGLSASSFDFSEFVALIMMNGSGLAWIASGISCWNRRYRESFNRALFGISIFIISPIVLLIWYVAVVLIYGTTIP